MCGIVGAFDPRKNVCPNKFIVNMRDAMTHRGPDGAGLWRSSMENCVLGHRRLSIIDVSINANQPMLNENSSVALVFNGEIYNHRELREEISNIKRFEWQTHHSDTETILRAYEIWGIDCIHRLKGMFSLAIFDQTDVTCPIMHLVRDRVGKKPLYVSRTNSGEWVFASEIRALFHHPCISPQMNENAFWHYLTFIVAPAPLTMFENIYKIPAGHRIEITHDGSAEAYQYWDCRPSKSQIVQRSEGETVSLLTSMLRESISRRMVSDVPFGVLLSGGVDSSMNVALMSELMSEPVKTYSIGYEGEDKTNEFDFARLVSKKFKTEHHETSISQKDAQEFIPDLVRLQDEPIADNVCIPLYFLSQLVKNTGTTVVQVGEGADENFLGYWWCEHYRQKALSVYEPVSKTKLVPWWQRFFKKTNQIMPVFDGEDYDISLRASNGEELFWGGAICWWGEMRNKLTPLNHLFKNGKPCPIKNLLPPSFQENDSSLVAQHYLGDLSGTLLAPEVLQKIPYMEMKLRLPEHLLMRVDKLTMANSVEARAPFLDHELVEFSNTIDPSLKLKDGVGKYILKRAAESFLEHDIIYRKKQGFGAPMEKWMKDEKFASRCLSAFRRSRMFKDGLLDGEYFEGLLKHQMGSGGGYSFHLWTVLNAALWHESWIEGNQDCF